MSKQQKVTIYALVDAGTHTVRYVGQAYDPLERLLAHLAEAATGKKPVHAWIRSLHPAKPFLVLLESVIPRQIEVAPHTSINLASIMEAKWMKRFRRTILNLDRKQCRAYDDFTNTPELVARLGLSE